MVREVQSATPPFAGAADAEATAAELDTPAAAMTPVSAIPAAEGSRRRRPTFERGLSGDLIIFPPSWYAIVDGPRVVCWFP